MAKDTQIAVADDEQAQHTVERLQTLNRVLDIHLPEQVGDIWNYAVQLENEASINLAKRGFVYLMLKEQLPHGNFETELKNKGIHIRTAQNAMSVANMLATLPTSKTKTLSLLGGSKLIELAKIPSESFEDLEKNGDLNIDEIDQMSVRDLKQHLRDVKLKLKKANLETELADKKLDAITRQQYENHQDANNVWPNKVTRARQESTALAGVAIKHIDQISMLLVDALTDDWTKEDGKFEQYADATLSTVAINLMSIHTKLSCVIKTMQKDWGKYDFFPEDFNGITPFSDEETTSIANQLKFMYDIEQVEANRREQIRLEKGEIKRSKGRPIGSKNKQQDA